MTLETDKQRRNIRALLFPGPPLGWVLDQGSVRLFSDLWIRETNTAIYLRWLAKLLRSLGEALTNQKRRELKD